MRDVARGQRPHLESTGKIFLEERLVVVATMRAWYNGSMSGHSKWSTIKRRKEAQDAKRGKIFIKIVREIIVATRSGGSDAETNPRLRAALQSARAANMPKDNITRAIERGSGASDSEHYHEIAYEGYGPHGVAIIAAALTDNKNRTAAEVRALFNKHNGNLGESGCVSYLFDTKGTIVFDGARYSEEEIFEAAIDAGADDVYNEEEARIVVCNPRELHRTAEKLLGASFEYSDAAIVKIPHSYVELAPEQSVQAEKLIESLEDLDDIQHIYSTLLVKE